MAKLSKMVFLVFHIYLITYVASSGFEYYYMTDVDINLHAEEPVETNWITLDSQCRIRSVIIVRKHFNKNNRQFYFGN